MTHDEAVAWVKKNYRTVPNWEPRPNEGTSLSFHMKMTLVLIDQMDTYHSGDRWHFVIQWERYVINYHALTILGYTK